MVKKSMKKTTKLALKHTVAHKSTRASHHATAKHVVTKHSLHSVSKKHKPTLHSKKPIAHVVSEKIILTPVPETHTETVVPAKHRESFKEGLLAGIPEFHKGVNLKEQLIASNAISKDYDKIFDEKLSEEYNQFRTMKEHHLQMKQFLRVLIVVVVIIIVALLLMNLRM